MKNRNIRLSVLASASLLGSFALTSLAQAQSPVSAQSVRYLSANCANCHGTNGAGAQGLPNLAGLKKEYIVEQMAAFKSGKREATLMHQIAKGYTDEQIAAMAEFFEQQAKR